MAVGFVPVRLAVDASAVVEFLTANEWPFHGLSRPSRVEAAAIRVVADDVVSFWICDGDETVGLIRLLDLDDLADGSPLFDVRIAERHRSRGIGRLAVDWLTGHLFTAHPELHRIEATTRHDNVAMQRVLVRCGYRQEGRMLEAWKNADGTWSDTLVYAILRREWPPDDRHLGR